jgi:hypothetical protein
VVTVATEFEQFPPATGWLKPRLYPASREGAAANSLQQGTVVKTFLIFPATFAILNPG